MNRQIRQLTAVILLAALMLGVLLLVHECNQGKVEDEIPVEMHVLTQDSVPAGKSVDKDAAKDSKKIGGKDGNKNGKKGKKKSKNSSKSKSTRKDPPRRSHRDEDPNAL